MTEKKDKPIPYKVGHLTYKLYRNKTAGWEAYIRWGGKAWKAHRVSKQDAENACEQHSREINSGEVVTRLSIEEARMLHEAKRILDPFKATLSDAARFYAEAHAGLEREVTVGESGREFLRQKADDGLSAVYLVHLGVAIRSFVEKFDEAPLNTVTPIAIDDWLRSLKSSARSRNNYRAVIVTLFRWARDRGYLPYGRPVAPERTNETKEAAKTISVLSPEKFLKLVDMACEKAETHPHAITCLMFAGHAGIRLAELARLKWEAVDVDAGHIEIGADIAKTASRRLVPINETFKEWIKSETREGRVIPNILAHTQMTSLWPKDDGKWPRNCLRHSFISYRLAEVQDVAQVALEAGNSPQKIFSNYRSIKLPDGRLITKELAAKWFAVTACKS